MSIYFVLNTEHRKYHEVIRGLSATHTGNLVPTLNLDGTKALIQVKRGQPRDDWMFTSRGLIIDKGDKALAQTTLSDHAVWGGDEEELPDPENDDFQTHRDFLEGRTTEEEYKTKLSESRTARTRG
jgi:hypothetical protein